MQTPVNSDSEEEESEENKDIQETNREEASKIPQEPHTTEEVETAQSPPVRRSSRTRKPPVRIEMSHSGQRYSERTEEGPEISLSEDESISSSLNSEEESNFQSGGADSDSSRTDD